MRFIGAVVFILTGTLFAESSPVFAQVIPEGTCAVIVASRPSLLEAQQWISQNPSSPARAIIKYGNGQYAVSIGLVDKANWRDSVASFVAMGQAPKDTFCSSQGAKFLAWVANASSQPTPFQTPAPNPVFPESVSPNPGSSSGQVATALLLFDGETGSIFAGCLNCSKYDNGSVCNRYGDYGSQYSDSSIWNPYGDFGSKYEQNSPWNNYGEGLRVVDSGGNYYGRFSLSSYEQSSLNLVQNIIAAYEAMENLEALRDLLCEG